MFKNTEKFELKQYDNGKIEILCHKGNITKEKLSSLFKSFITKENLSKIEGKVLRDKFLNYLLENKIEVISVCCE